MSNFIRKLRWYMHRIARWWYQDGCGGEGYHVIGHDEIIVCNKWGCH